MRCRIKFVTDVDARAFAVNGDDRPSVAQLLESGATRDDRHIVTSLGQLKSERTTDTARPDYRDLHLPINTSTRTGVVVGGRGTTTPRRSIRMSDEDGAAGHTKAEDEALTEVLCRLLARCLKANVSGPDNSTVEHRAVPKDPDRLAQR